MEEKPTISLKLHIDTRAYRVLFAEVKKDFMDFLSHMLSLPLATANRLLRKQGMTVGSISNLCSSIQSLDVCYVEQKAKDTILNPPLCHANDSIPYVPLLLPENLTSLGEKITLYRCSFCNLVIATSRYCSRCRSSCYMKTWDLYEPQSSVNYKSGFVEGVFTYIVMDNLDVKPMSDFSVIKHILNEFDVTNVALLEEKVVKLGVDEALKLLKASLESQTVLTDVFLKSTRTSV